VGLGKVLKNSYPWPMHDFRKPITLVFAVVIFFATANAANAQTLPSSSATNPGAQPSTGPAQETPARGYWVDPSTGLMWAAKDNGKDVSWGKAMKYCRKLRLAGYSDWRLATLAELGAIYDRNANAPGLTAMHDDVHTMWHVKGNLFLTGDEWSSERRYDDRGHPSGYEWYYNFNEGRSDNDPSGFPYSSTLMRALCVRGTEK
jgi:Protein of unknown function (DUF1566)